MQMGRRGDDEAGCSLATHNNLQRLPPKCFFFFLSLYPTADYSAGVVLFGSPGSAAHATLFRSLSPLSLLSGRGAAALLGGVKDATLRSVEATEVDSRRERTDEGGREGRREGCFLWGGSRSPFKTRLRSGIEVDAQRPLRGFRDGFVCLFVCLLVW